MLTLGSYASLPLDNRIGVFVICYDLKLIWVDGKNVYVRAKC